MTLGDILVTMFLIVVGGWAIGAALGSVGNWIERHFR